LGLGIGLYAVSADSGISRELCADAAETTKKKNKINASEELRLQLLKLIQTCAVNLMNRQF
jgi:hypothetical protein